MVDAPTERLQIRRLPAMARHILRCRDVRIAAASDILGIALPRTACRSASQGDLHALWLGPDEWLILGRDDVAGRLAAGAEPLAAIGAGFVDVGHRQQAIAVTGAAVETWLASGCPLDLALPAFPIGACTRSLFHKAEIVLWRTAAAAFHLEVWRSFADYVETLLIDGEADAAGLR